MTIYHSATAERRSVVYLVQLIKPPTEPGQAAALVREYGYAARAAAEQIGAEWRRMQGVRDGVLLVRVVERAVPRGAPS